MSEADQFPDPDLSFLEGTTGEDIAAVGRGLDESAQQLDRQTREIADQAQTATVDRVLDALVDIKKGLETAAAAADTAAAAFRAMQQAWEEWKANAPRQIEIVSAEQEVADARQQLMVADGPHAALFRRKLKAAEAKLTGLIERRKAADAELAAALEAAQSMLPSPGPIPELPSGVDGTTPKTLPTPGPTTSPPGPAASAPAPGGELPGTSLPGETLPPGTSLSGMGETPLTATGSNPSAAAALAALAAQQQQPQQPVQIPQPMAPAMAAPQQQQKPAENPFGSAGEPIDLAALLGPAAMGALAGAGAAPGLSSAISSPAITPLNPTVGPTFTPLGPVGSLTPAPVVNPIVTGTSVSGLTTDSNVTGRADGTAARTATSPSPATGLSGAHTDQATARPGGMGTGMGMGAPMMPMSPMMGGMGGGGAGKDREMVTATMTPEQAKLLGLETIGEAVPGGTIARKED